MSRLNAEVGATLAASFPVLWIQGELSNLARPRSGHLYFTLKDSAAQVRCALFRNRRQQIRYQPADGEQVLLRARVALYEPRGDFQLIVEHLEPAGAGALQRAFEELKAKLQAEGLFDTARKAPLPAFPRHLGIITSPSGAAIHDVLKVLRRRFPGLPVTIFPALVQGADAPGSLLGALQTAVARDDCDVLLLTRGGGSAEDLAPFNDEDLARAIAACPIPVVSAVGHEVDFTIGDFVADRRAPTPSAAAELIAPDQDEVTRRLEQLGNRLVSLLRHALQGHRLRLRGASSRLQLLAPGNRIRQQQQRADELELRLGRLARLALKNRNERLQDLSTRLLASGPRRQLQAAADRLRPLPRRLESITNHRLALARSRLGACVGRLEAISPLATLTRGYAIVTHEKSGNIIRNATQVQAGDRLAIRLAEGRVSADVVDTAPNAGHPATCDP